MRFGMALLCLCGLAYVGCAPSSAERIRARVDPISIQDPQQFEQDVAACSMYADQAGSMANREAGGESVKRGAIGGAGGAAAGAAIGAIADGGSGAGKGAAIGAVGGVTAGALSTMNDATHKKDQALRNCMANRGYRMLY